MSHTFITRQVKSLLRLTRFVVLFTCAPFAAYAQLVSSFSDVTYWVGSGTNESVLVIDWNDGKNPASLVWGYRWDYDTNGDAPTGMDMLKDVALDDPRLITALLFADTFVFGIGYDTDGDGSSFTIGSPGVGTETGSASHPIDRYKEGFFENGYWSYYLYGGNITYTIYDSSFNPIGVGNYNQTGTTSYAVASSDWWSSQVGAADRRLVPNSWDVWNWAPNFIPGTIDQPVAAIPEPSAWALILLAAAGLIAIRRGCQTLRQT
ncbi:MAG: PEP-CTERM sorting domain-containing protein [Verrucomicrobiia bacterium]